MQPFDLRCEYLRDPVGVDVAVPRFSWKLLVASGLRGARQSAYQVRAATSFALLDHDQADLWDSGWVASPDSVLVPYGGQHLVSHQSVCWQVRVKNRDGAVSGWSDIARFTMGLLSEADWHGAWIRHPDAPDSRHIWYRKRISIEDVMESAVIHVATLGYHEVYVNGLRVGDYALAPAVSRLDKRVLYCSYDISGMLRPGENTVAVWQGPGWARYKYFSLQPALRVQMVARAGNGAVQELVSDTSWRCEAASSENTGACQYRDHGGERIDARRHIPDWSCTDFDDSGWPYAVALPLQVALSAQMIEPTRVIETIKAKSIVRQGDAYRFDMGKNFTGRLTVHVRGLSAGDEVLIQVANQPGEVEDFAQRSYFTSAGEPEEVFRHRFNYAAGRYVTLTGLKSVPRLDDVTGEVLSTDLRRTGSFVSAFPLLNEIYEADLCTWRANLVEGFTMDCPHRERLGYGEVAFACAWGIAFPNYDSGALYMKHVRDWSDVQEANGWIHHTAPQINQHYGGPMWSSAGLNIAWRFYEQFGDRRILELTYPSSKRWLEFLQAHVRDGLLRNYNEHWGKFLGDWAAPEQRKERGDSPEAEYFNNCVYALNLDYFVRMAVVLGHTADAALYRERLNALRERVHANYYQPETCLYANGTQVQLAFALLTGITPEPLRPAVIASLQRALREKGYLDMGSSGLPVLLKYLVEHADNSDALLDLLGSTKEPGYGYFLARGENTWPEYWNVDVPSRIHTCYTGVSSWLSMGLAGIRPDPACPGFQSFLINPVMPEGLTFAEGEQQSHYGTIRSRWNRQSDSIQLAVTIPPHSDATIYMPARSLDDMTESGQPIRDAQGVAYLRMEAGRAVLRVASGDYVFVSKVPPPC
jgi:alpha-L-rhamnosidase